MRKKQGLIFIAITAIAATVVTSIWEKKNKNKILKDRVMEEVTYKYTFNGDDIEKEENIIFKRED